MDTDETAKEKLEKIANTTDLATAIQRLDRRRHLQEEELSTHFHELMDSLKPANILKSTLHEVQESTPLKHNLLKIAIGLGAGYFSRKLIVSESAGLLKKALGTVVQYGITNFIARRPEEDDENGQSHNSKFPWIKKLFHKKDKSIA